MQDEMGTKSLAYTTLHLLAHSCLLHDYEKGQRPLSKGKRPPVTSHRPKQIRPHQRDRKQISLDEGRHTEPEAKGEAIEAGIKDHDISFSAQWDLTMLNQFCPPPLPSTSCGAAP